MNSGLGVGEFEDEIGGNGVTVAVVGKGHSGEVVSGRTTSWMRLVLVGEAAIRGCQDGVLGSYHPTSLGIDEGDSKEDGGVGTGVLGCPGEASVFGGHDLAVPSDGETVCGIGEGHPEDLGGGSRRLESPVLAPVCGVEDCARATDRPTRIDVYEHHVDQVVERGVGVVLGLGREVEATVSGD